MLTHLLRLWIFDDKYMKWLHFYTAFIHAFCKYNTHTHSVHIYHVHTNSIEGSNTSGLRGGINVKNSFIIVYYVKK